jgi:demethylmenaquinone methyltransferase / 2-methoxy-6-polyprenyl-1,4-benzoquinol methylase
VRIIGRALSFLVARAPWLWPLMRGPTTSFWNRMASGWGARISPERTRALGAGLARVGEPRRILEVGTGTGSGAALLAERFPHADITAVDLSEEMVRLAREALPAVRFEVADAAALPFPDANFDLVVQLNVPVYFRELARVTAPGGRILIASTFGPATPYYTPHALLRRRFQALGLAVHAAEPAPPGDFFIASRAA